MGVGMSSFRFLLLCLGLGGMRADEFMIVALPALLAHSEIIRWAAALMSITGGVLIYGTIIAFGMFFQEESEF